MVSGGTSAAAQEVRRSNARDDAHRSGAMAFFIEISLRLRIDVLLPRASTVTSPATAMRTLSSRARVAEVIEVSFSRWALQGNGGHAAQDCCSSARFAPMWKHANAALRPPGSFFG